MALIDVVARSFKTTESAIQNQVSGITYTDITEPTYLVFEPIFNFNMQSGLLADESYQNSALAYLKRVGENARYVKLKNGISSLQTILNDSPWIFESVTGFQETLDAEMAEVEILDQRIHFQLWETLDMRVSNFIQSTFDAIFDYNGRMVEILPRNLQEFSMGLLIHEVRVFSDPNGNVKRGLNQGEDNSGLSVIKTNHTLLNFGKCRFRRSTGNSYFSEFSNVEVNQAKVNLDIEYKRLVRTHNFNSFVQEVVIASEEPNKNQTQLQRLTNPLNNQLGDYKGLVSSTVDSVANITRDNNFLNIDSYSGAGASMQQLANQLGISRSVAGGVISSANKAINDVQTFEKSFGNFFEEDMKNITGFIPKRLNINTFGEAIDKYYEALKNPALWSVVDTLSSNLKVNQRRSINIYNE